MLSPPTGQKQGKFKMRPTLQVSSKQQIQDGCGAGNHALTKRKLGCEIQARNNRHSDTVFNGPAPALTKIHKGNTRTEARAQWSSTLLTVLVMACGGLNSMA